MKKLALIAFIIIATIQWWMPGSMIWQKEKVLKKGTPYKFETEPVDPSNPFKGKYISLRFKINQIKNSAYSSLDRAQDIYVLLSNDDSGFASIKAVTPDVPADGNDYIKAKVDYVYDSVLYINYPFQEFYMEESKAPEAEKIYRESNRNNNLTANKTYALIKVWKGDAVIQDVFINNRPVGELIK